MLLSSLVFALLAAADDFDTNPQGCNVHFTWHFDDDGVTAIATCQKEETAEDASQAPDSGIPWAAESPGAAGATYGVGGGYLFAWQDDLRNTFVETQSTTRGADGGETMASLPGDPDLNNRKFDFDWHLSGPTFQAPLALPEFSLGGTTVFPSLVFEAGLANVDLQFHDRSDPELDNSLDGDGPFVGLRFDLTAPLCSNCRWFTGGGLRSRFLPEMDVDRSPAFAEPGFEVIEDDVDLQWESYEAYARLGYDFGKVAPYLGVRGQETRVKIDDHLRFTGELDQTLDTQAEFESDSFTPLLGLEAHLGGRFFGRVEAGVGNDSAVLFKVTYLPGAKPRPAADDKPEDPPCEEPAETCWEIILGSPDE